jgi:hypothetical protein
MSSDAIGGIPERHYPMAALGGSAIIEALGG